MIESRDLLLNADAIERARDLAVEQSDQTPGELEAGREEATAAIKKLETDITNLVTLAASSGSAALLDGIKSRERQKADL